MERIELLAPAGSMESLIAAINRGADAIYLGGSKFSARAYASNFDNETMEKAVDYAHTYGAKVYVTVNTLIKENEFQEAIDYIGVLYKIGVDALIIQDVGLAKRIKEVYPDFELHASTQMSIHNGEGALFFRENGFYRIVLSRELTLEEIKHISKDLGIETEIFVHGALCVCYSGQCLMSSLIGGRSGNRGRCAQSCRLPYTLIREKDNKETKGFLLSPKDICTIENVEDLIKTGTSSLKIEGRMKRPEYVAGVIESYKEAIENSYNNIKKSQEENKLKLKKLFNREGFSTAYMYKNVGKDMMAFKTPRNTGILLGEVLKSGEVLLVDDLSLKDGIRTNDDGFTVSKILMGNQEVTEAKKGDKVKIFPKKYKVNDKLYKTSDTKLLNELKVAYENPYERKINLKAYMKFKVNEPMELTVEYNGNYFTKAGEVVQVAVNRPMDKEKVEKNLRKSGDIPYQIEDIEYVTFEDGFAAVSSINNLRREVLEEIRNSEIQKYKRVLEKQSDVELNEKVGEMPAVLVVVNTKEQLQAAINGGVKDIALDIFGKNQGQLHKNAIKEAKAEEVNLYIKVPTIIKEEFDVICKIIDENLDLVKGLVTANTGIINVYKDKTNIIGDYKLNIFNAYGMKFYNEHMMGSCLSLELNKKELNKMLKKYSKGAQMFVYGRPEVMVSEYCPIGSTFGGKSTTRNCDNQCVSSTFILKDRMNQDFVIRTDIFCRSHIYNTVPVNLLQEVDEIKSLGINSFRLDFVDESYDEVMQVIEALNKEEALRLKDYTKGHFKRGVE